MNIRVHRQENEIENNMLEEFSNVKTYIGLKKYLIQSSLEDITMAMDMLKTYSPKKQDYKIFLQLIINQ